LADGTGSYPDFSLHDLKDESSEKERPSGDPALLASLVGVTDGSIGAFLTVDGSWSSPDGVRATVSSAMVPAAQSNVVARTLGTAPLSQMWLPTFEHHEDEDQGDRQRFADMAPVEPWITDARVELKIDQHDPYASGDAVKRARPAEHIIKAFSLRADHPWADAWRNESGSAVLRSLAWGRTEGEGERETSDSGSALQCEPVFLSELLSALDRYLIVLVKLQHYRERQRYEATEYDQDDPFTYAYSVLLIGSDLRVEHIVPTEHEFHVVEALDQHRRYEFASRLRALSAVRP
jgi:hypothetical protein